MLLNFRAHIRTRVLVEQGFGQTKRRFHCLHVELRVNPSKACKIFVACAVLHNICKDIGLLDDDIENYHNGDDDQQNFILPHDISMRAHITQTYFA